MKSLRNNRYLQNLDVSDEDLIAITQIQSVYKIQQSHWAHLRYGFRIMLIWDHDRIWGSFELGFFNGILLVDPGPSVDSLKTYPFTWRGTSTETPDAIFNSHMTTGEIVLGETGNINGHFDAMLGVGLPENRCYFTGRRIPGPPVVPRSLESFIGEWNDCACSLFDLENEVPRSLADVNPASLGSRSPEPTSKESSDEWTEEDNSDFLNFVTGVYEVNSEAIEHEWSSKRHSVSIRLHFDDELGKIWGKFDMGICRGFLLYKNSPGSLKPDETSQFRWRGTEDETGDRMSGKGEITLTDDRKISGFFYDMWGDVDFEGTKKLMPSHLIREYTAQYYRNEWRDLDNE